MNNKFFLFRRNFSYAFSANIVSFLFNIIILLTIPKLIGVTEYGYFQYYMLLTTYLFVLHFGWIDGIYLRYGGHKYEELDFQTFSEQFWGIIIFCSVQILFFLNLLNNFNVDKDKYFVFLYVILSIFFVLPRTFFSIILQVTNRMKEYSLLLITERIFYALFLGIMLFSGVRNFKFLLIGDLAGKMFSLIYGIICCPNIVNKRPKFSKNTFLEVRANIGAGVFLVLSNLFSLIITGITQIFIENKWNIETFSKVSLTFNISRMLMVVINSVSVVMFPLIKTVKREDFPNLYMQIRKATMLILMAILIFYYPMKILLTIWLPQYADSFVYVALLLPMCIFESKSAMLVSTFLKALRKETALFLVNVIVFIISTSISLITVYLISSLELAVLSITISLMIKSILLEYFVSRVIPIKVTKDIIIELLIVSIFITSSWFIDSWVSCLIYLSVYCIYLFINKSYLRELRLLLEGRLYRPPLSRHDY